MGDYHIQMTIRNKLNNFRWVSMCVYGPAQHDKSRDFIDELTTTCSQCALPLVMGGYFNLIRNMTEKSSNNCDQSLMDLFNTFIGDFQLKEIRRSGPKFTWTNKQDYPVMVVLDRFLISTDWEVRFPLCLAWSLTRVGSDHSPIILDSGEQGNPRTKYFFFENKWLLDQDLVGLVTQK